MPKSTYYQSFHQVKSARRLENEKMLERIRHHHTESRQRYGAPKIHVLLGKEGIRTSINRVQRMMRRHSLRSVIVKKFRPEPSVSKVEERENVLDQDFSTSDINEKWVGDITYIHTLRDGWCYLASVLDLHSKKIVGYSFGKRMTTDLVLDRPEKCHHCSAAERSETDPPHRPWQPIYKYSF